MESSAFLINVPVNFFYSETSCFVIQIFIVIANKELIASYFIYIRAFCFLVRPYYLPAQKGFSDRVY